MSEHREHSPQTAHDSHEEFDREIGTRDVIKTGVWLAGGTAASMALAGLFLVGIAALERRSDPPPNPMAEDIQAMNAQGFPGPQLQPSPTVDMSAHRHAEEKVLGSYGWVNQDNGIVRVPITRAMEMLVERHRTAVPAPTAGSTP